MVLVICVLPLSYTDQRFINSIIFSKNQLLILLVFSYCFPDSSLIDFRSILLYFFLILLPIFSSLVKLLSHNLNLGIILLRILCLWNECVRSQVGARWLLMSLPTLWFCDFYEPEDKNDTIKWHLLFWHFCESHTLEVCNSVYSIPLNVGWSLNMCQDGLA